MKILVINGSPKGEAGNTNVMVDALLKGAREAGAETVKVFLADKEIEHCKGCHVCWSKGPGQCVIKDDVLGVLALMGTVDVIAFASPVYFENISGRLKAFMDRMTMIGGPQTQSTATEAAQSKPESKPEKPQGPKLMMISSCGHPDREEFAVTSLWINRVAKKMNMELMAEIYSGRGKFLKEAPQEFKPAVDKYLQLLEQAGKEIALEGGLSQETKQLLHYGIVA